MTSYVRGPLQHDAEEVVGGLVLALHALLLGRCLAGDYNTENLSTIIMINNDNANDDTKHNNVYTNGTNTNNTNERPCRRPEPSTGRPPTG